MAEFLNSWYGILAFVLFDVVALIAIIAITYRWFFKRILDVIFSSIAIALTSPLFLTVFLRGKKFQKEHEGVLPSLTEKQVFIGKKEKRVYTHTYKTRDEDGEVFGRYGRWLEETGLYKLPWLLDVFFGRISFVGVKKMLPSEAMFVDEENKERFTMRSGLINPLVLKGDEETTYEEMFLSDRRYVAYGGLYTDVKIFFKWLLKKIRGEGREYLGQVENTLYSVYLLEKEEITDEDYFAALDLDRKQA